MHVYIYCTIQSKFVKKNQKKNHKTPKETKTTKQQQTKQQQTKQQKQKTSIHKHLLNKPKTM